MAKSVPFNGGFVPFIGSNRPIHWRFLSHSLAVLSHPMVVCCPFTGRTFQEASSGGNIRRASIRSSPRSAKFSNAVQARRASSRRFVFMLLGYANAIASSSSSGSYGSIPVFRSQRPSFGAWVRPGSCHRNDSPISARYAGALSAPHWSRRFGNCTPPATSGGMSKTTRIGMSRSMRPNSWLMRI